VDLFPGTKSITFKPEILVKAVRNFLNTSLSPVLKDTKTCLVERQRYYTHGFGKIPMPVLYINMVETLLHALLPQIGVDNIIGVDPRKVSLWLEEQQTTNIILKSTSGLKDEAQSAASKAARRRALKKYASKIFLDTLLHNNATLHVSSPSLISLYQSLPKQDDISDSVTQALAYYSWQSYTREQLSQESQFQEWLKREESLK